MDVVALSRVSTASYWRGLGQRHTWTNWWMFVALSRVSSQLLKVVRAASHLDQLMDVVALSRVSSQLLKGVRAASHLDQLMDVVALSRVSTASYWRGLGQRHTWTTDGCRCIEQGIHSQLLKGVRAASHLDNWWMLLHWAGCLASYWRWLGQRHTWTNWWMLLHWAGCLASYWRGLGQRHTWTNWWMLLHWAGYPQPVIEGG